MNTNQENALTKGALILQKSLARIQEAGVNADLASFSWFDMHNEIYLHYSTAINWSKIAFKLKIINKPGFIKNFVKKGFYMDCDSPFEEEARKVLKEDNVKVDAKATVLNCLEDNGYITIVINNASTDLSPEKLKALMRFEALRLSYDLKKADLLTYDLATRVHDMEALKENHYNDSNPIDTKLIPNVSKINAMPSILVSGIKVTGDMLVLARLTVKNWSQKECEDRGITQNFKHNARRKVTRAGFNNIGDFIAFLEKNHVLEVIPQIIPQHK